MQNIDKIYFESFGRKKLTTLRILFLLLGFYDKKTI